MCSWSPSQLCHRLSRKEAEIWWGCCRKRAKPFAVGVLCLSPIWDTLQLVFPQNQIMAHAFMAWMVLMRERATMTRSCQVGVCVQRTPAIPGTGRKALLPATDEHSQPSLGRRAFVTKFHSGNFMIFLPLLSIYVQRHIFVGEACRENGLWVVEGYLMPHTGDTVNKRIIQLVYGFYSEKQSFKGSAAVILGLFIQ